MKYADMMELRAASERIRELEAACAAKHEALRQIRDHKPEPVNEEIDHDSDNCPDCERMKGHPISNGRCNTWFRLYYQREDARKRAENRQQYQMRSIARQALEDNPGAGLLEVVEAAKPFGEYAEYQLNFGLPSGIAADDSTPVWGNAFNGEPDVTVGNLRRLHKALAALGKE